MMINTRNESALHKTLKALCAMESGSRVEAALDGKIYDVVDARGGVVEIQTRNLSALLAKTMAALAKGRAVTVVWPAIVQKTIETRRADGTLVSRRKSPRKGSIHDIWRELTGLYPVLLEKKFSLAALEVSVTETRTATEEKTQSPNGRRRFLKRWNKTGKSLGEIFSSRVLKSARDYIALMPRGLPKIFCAKDVERALLADKSLPASAARSAHLMLWTLSRMGLLESACAPEGGSPRAKYYKIKTRRKQRAKRRSGDEAPNP